ncbi:MAG: hypothetical protein KDJ28_07610 [Candidatus Competibacteraceae bacterium]|nr:hypothetical protein [Candidatus Competibacteraceae bacterium]
MNTGTDFSTLLWELFQGSSRQISALLQPLTTEQRKALFAEFKDLLKVLKRACRFRVDAKAMGLSDLYRAIRDDPAAFLQERADTLAAPGALNNPQLMSQLSYNQLMKFYNRLELLQVGLAGKGGIAGVFRHSEQYPAWTTQFVLQAGQTLLDRPESWVRDALLQVFTDLEQRMRFAGADLGVALLMREARQRHPDWADALAPHLGRAMRRDGFFKRTLKGCDNDMILAGLEYAPPSGDLASFEPLMDPKIVEALLQRMAEGQLSRADLIALTLRKLQSPLRPGVAKTWLEFQQRLALSDAEIREHAEAYINLLNAPAPAAVKLALATVEKHFLADADSKIPPNPPLPKGGTERLQELIGALGYLLQNPVQTLAKSALRLLKKLRKTNPDLHESVLNAAVAGLGNPHAALRHDLARWLGAFPPQVWSEEALAALQSMAPELPLTEQAPLAHLLAVDSEQSPVDSTLRVTPEAALPDRHTDLCARVALLKQRVVEQPGDDLLHRRLTVLEAYLATGECPLLEPTAADHTSALTPADFALHETPEALAVDMARTRQRVFTLADYDRILAGMARFAPGDDASRTHAILAPMLNRFDQWRNEPTGGASFGQAGELSGFVLAYAWQTGGLPDFPKNSWGQQLLRIQFSPALQRRLKHVLKLHAAGHDTLLSVPTHTVGWLSLEMFAERFARLPRPLLDADELAAALYRLPALPEPRAATWARLASLVESRSEALDEGVALALAPDERARKALDWFIDRFARSPPSEKLFQPLTGFTGGDLVEAFRVKVLHQTPDTPENAAFRLFNAALRCRFGLADAGIDRQTVSFAQGLAPKGGWLSRAFSWSLTDSLPFAELLFAPHPVTAALAEEARLGIDGLFVHDTSYPFLWPYLLAHPHHFATSEQAANLAYQFPPLAQRLFEAGLCRLGGKQDYYRDLTLSLLNQGRLPQADVRPYLGLAARGLAVSQAPLREGCVDLLAQWLKDGRITPVDGAAALTAAIRQTGQGFVHLEQALASLSATGDLGSATVLLALEQAIGAGVAEFPPRKLSLMLDRLLAVLEDTCATVREPAAREVLEVLAAAKKSVSRDKASAILTRRGHPDQPPAWVLALATLSDE